MSLLATVTILLAFRLMPQPHEALGVASNPAPVVGSEIVDLYVCREDEDVSVVDVHLELRIKNRRAEPLYIPGELGLLRQSLAADLQSAQTERWEVPALVADAFAVGPVRELVRSDLVRIAPQGEWREQLTTSVRVKRNASADDPMAVAPGVHYIVLELRTLPLWARAPSSRHIVETDQLWVQPIVVPPQRVDTAKAVPAGDCADRQIEWMNGAPE